MCVHCLELGTEAVRDAGQIPKMLHSKAAANLVLMASPQSGCPQSGLNFRDTVAFREKVPLLSPGDIVGRLTSKNQIQNRAGAEIRSRTSVPLRNSRFSFIHTHSLISEQSQKAYSVLDATLVPGIQSLV